MQDQFGKTVYEEVQFRRHVSTVICSDGEDDASRTKTFVDFRDDTKWKHSVPFVPSQFGDVELVI